MDQPPLSLSTEEMRAAGYRVIDAIVDHLSTLPEQRVGAMADVSDLQNPLPPIPERGADFSAILDEVQSTVLASTMHLNHPRFFAYVPSPGNFVGAMADAIASAWNVFSGSWISGSGAALIERTVIDWLRVECGLPAEAGGLFVSGGTMANLTGLAVARHARLGDMRDRKSTRLNSSHANLVSRLLIAKETQPR